MVDSNVPTGNLSPKIKKRKGRPQGSTKNAKYLPQMKETMLELSRCGKSLTQIAVALSDLHKMPIIADTLIGWEKSQGDAYSKHLKLCRTYAQAFHEQVLEDMITGTNGKYSSSEISAQQWKLKTLFADWGDKAQKIEVSQLDNMGDKELEAKVVALLKRTGKLPTQLKVVNGKETDK